MRIRVLSMMLAALALTATPAFASGWYLMAPLVEDHAPYVVHTEFPIAYWERIQGFDSSEKCEATLALYDKRSQSAEWKRYWDAVSRSPHEQSETRKEGRFIMPWASYRKRISFSQCVASDDPTLVPPPPPTDTDPPPPLPPDSPSFSTDGKQCPLGQSC